MEGFHQTNDQIRGERNGYNKKVEVMNRLITVGGRDLGFATTFQDENVEEIIHMYRYAKGLKVEFATSALHNAFQFHKNDNYIYEKLLVARKVEELITEMLESWIVKNWFRAYLNLGLIAKILGKDRLHPCTQGTDNVFIDPWGDVYACNVRNDLLMGNLRKQAWNDIYNSDGASEIRKKVSLCPQNCWMVSSAKTAMRNKQFSWFPKTNVLKWVIWNKFKATFRLPIAFEKYVDYTAIQQNTGIVRRRSFLENPEKKVVQPSESRHYTQLNGYFNR